jgi:signal transduction histidine kinase
LIPGDYELEIRGVGSNRVESEPYLLSVSVVAPFWQQVWFRISLFVLLAGTVIAFIYFNYRRKIGKALQELEQQKLLAAERNRISRDLHDDIGSAITKITLISELIPLQQKSNDLVLEDVKNISATARTVSQNMSDIVWALHAQHDSLEGLLSYMREQVREFLDPLGMKYWLAFPEEVPELKLNGEQRRNILLVTKEALNNAVKYSGAKLIIVACRPGSGMIEFSVTDDGKGFDLKQAREHGNGLKNMSRRMESIGGDLEILSSAGGTTIVYRLKI